MFKRLCSSLQVGEKVAFWFIGRKVRGFGEIVSVGEWKVRVKMINNERDVYFGDLIGVLDKDDKYRELKIC